ncbi:MAG: tetratricopeptide repeat protein [Pseudobdellovibrionaceae bacterium]
MNKTVIIFLLGLVVFTARPALAQGGSNPAENPSFKVAMDAFQADHLAEARMGLLTLVNAEPKQQLYWFNLGHVYYKLNNFPKALECYQKVRGLEGSLSLPAAYYQAVCENNMGQSKKAQETLKAVIENPQTPENLRSKSSHFKRTLKEGEDEASAAAMKYFNQEEYDKSLSEIEKSDLSETPEAFLLRGMSYKSLDKPEEAKKYLQLSERYSQKPDIRESSRTLLADLNEKERPTPGAGFSGAVTFDLGSDSNIYQVKSATSSSIMDFNLEVYYQNNLSPQLSLTPGYNFRSSRFVKDSSLNTMSHFFNLDLEYTPTHWVLEVSPFLELMQSPYDLASFGSDYLIKLNYEKWALGVSGTALHQQSLAAAENYLDGNMLAAKLFLEIKNPISMLQLYALRVISATGDLPVTKGTQTGTLPLAYSGIERGLYTVVSFAKSWKFYGRLSVLDKDYDNVSAPTKVKRKDISSNIFLKAKYEFTPDWSGFASFNFTNNQSTLGPNDIENKNYSEFVNKFGVQWSW